MIVLLKAKYHQVLSLLDNDDNELRKNLARQGRSNINNQDFY